MLLINSIMLVCFQVQFKEKLSHKRQRDFSQMSAVPDRSPLPHFYSVHEKKRKVLIKKSVCK